MKLFFLQLLLLAVFAAVEAADPVDCEPVAATCRGLPYASYKSCSSIISSRRISIASCRYPKSTVTTRTTTFPTTTRTSTILAKTTTRTVTSTTTIRGPTVSLTPTTVSVTRTTTVQSTTVTTSPTITTTTTTTVQSFSESTTTTTTATTSTDSTWTQDACPITITERGLWNMVRGLIRHPQTSGVHDLRSEWEEGQRFHRRFAGAPDDMWKRDSIPDVCSCYLTSTKLDVKPETETSVITRRITSTVTTIVGGTKPTLTRTSTVRKTTSIPGVTYPRSTSTITSTSTSTQVVTSTFTSTSTSTTVFTTSTTSTSVSTSVSTTTTTVGVYPCSPGEYGVSDVGGSLFSYDADHFGGLLVSAGDPDGDEKCCIDCFSKPGCAYWYRDYSFGGCVNAIVKLHFPKECDTPQCPNGRVRPIRFNAQGGRTFHPGPCGPQIQDPPIQS